MSEQPTSPTTANPVDESVTALLTPIIATTGAELLDVEWAGGTLRIVVDEPAPAAGTITADRLAEVNRLISPVLDQHDPVPGRYLLEVSSPGVERSLRRPEHFTRAVGEDVIVKMAPGSDPRRLRGRLVAFEDGNLEIDAVEADGVDLAEVERHSVTLDDVAKAKTHFDWGPSSPGGNKNQKKKSGGKQPSGKKKPQNKNAPKKKQRNKNAPKKQSQNKNAPKKSPNKKSRRGNQ